VTLLGVVHSTAEQGGGAAELDGGGNGARTAEAAGHASEILGRSGGDRGLPVEPAPNQESCQSHTL
jgi:hypothetical protein